MRHVASARAKSTAEWTSTGLLRTAGEAVTGERPARWVNAADGEPLDLDGVEELVVKRRTCTHGLR
jgi:hypothetical protein